MKELVLWAVNYTIKARQAPMIVTIIVYKAFLLLLFINHPHITAPVDWA